MPNSTSGRENMNVIESDSLDLDSWFWSRFTWFLSKCLVFISSCFQHSSVQLKLLYFEFRVCVIPSLSDYSLIAFLLTDIWLHLACFHIFIFNVRRRGSTSFYNPQVQREPFCLQQAGKASGKHASPSCIWQGGCVLFTSSYLLPMVNLTH